MENIKKIYNRLTIVQVKERVLPLFLSALNIILALIVLVFANVIISNGKSFGELNYQMIRNFYMSSLFICLLIITIFTPYFLSGSINSLVKNNTYDYMLTTNIRKSEIVYAVFLRGLASTIVILFSSFPIVIISLYFGGVGVIKAIKAIICLSAFTVFFSSICLLISSSFTDKNLSILLSYVLGAVFLLIHWFLIMILLSSNVLLVIYLCFVVVLVFIILALSINGKAFDK